MHDRDEHIRTLCAQQAADWFLAHREGVLSSSEQRAFGEWLAASPLHVEEFLGVAAVAQALPRAAEDPSWSVEAVVDRALASENRQLARLPSIADGEPAKGSSRYRARNWSAVAATVVAISFVWLFWFGRDDTVSTHYQTGHGGQQTVRLSDSSVLYLNTDTSLTVRYEQDERLVVIDRGEAMFDVAHETARPFRVLAGHADVVAVGTAFAVYRQPNAIVVTVNSGLVSVGRPVAKAQRVLVAAGEQLRIGDDVTSTAPTKVIASSHLAWMRRQIVFDNQPLAAVAAEFNRYSDVPISIESSELNSLRVSGVFSVDDTESFVAFLRRLDGVTVAVAPTRIRVAGVPKRPGPGPEAQR